MNEAVEKLKALRDKKSARIDQLQSEMQECQSAIRELAGQLEGIEEAINAVSGISAGVTAATPPLPSIGKYNGIKSTEAILDVVTLHGTPPGLLVPEILEKLKQEGFKSEAKELYSVVYSIAQRLVKSGKIKESKKDGKRSFMRKQPF